MNQSTFTRFLALLVALCCSIASFAQTGSVTGKVIDEKKQPVFAATVVVAGTTLGASTDADGVYTIDGISPSEVRIQVSYIGYETKENSVKVVAGKTATLDFALGENKEMLDVVIVTGYGQTQQRRDLTGSISKIDSKTLNGQPVQSFEQALQGNATGVQVTQGSGVAGSASIIRIRGASSISAGGDPLYVIDGVPILQDVFLGGGTRGNQNYNPLASINPTDIESVEVLKDAAAAAIYGSRGSNGVILVTTKRGKSKDGKPSFTFSTRLGFGEPTKQQRFLNNTELLDVWQRGWENDGNTGRAPLPAYYTRQGYTYADAEKTNTNWQDLLVRKGFKQEYNLGMSTQSKNGVWGAYVGTSYNNNESFIKGNNQERMSVRANIDFKPTKNFKASLTSSLTRNLINRNGTPDFWSGWIGAQAYFLPIFPVYDKNGDFFAPHINPLAQAENNKLQNLEWRTVNSLNLSYNITPELTLNANGSYDFLNNSDYQMRTAEWGRLTDPRNSQNWNAYSKTWQTIGKNLNAYATVNYDFKKILPEAHRLNVMLGGEMQDRTTGKQEREYFGFENFEYAMTNIGDTAGTWNKGGSKWWKNNKGIRGADTDSTHFLSGFARFNYNLKDRYQVQATLRYDGSNVFGKNNRWGFFPSLGLGWTMSEEKFWGNLKKTVSFAKLRASFGVTGNSNLGWTQQFGGYSTAAAPNLAGSSYNGNNTTAYYYKKENPNLQWDEKYTYDAGVQLGFFNDRIVADLTGYYTLAPRSFIQVISATSSQLGNLYYNLASVENKGVEFGITSRNIVSKSATGFKWTTVLNMSSNENKVLDAGGYQPDALPSFFGDLRTVKDYYVGTHYKVRFAGVDAQTGLPIYYAADGVTTRTGADAYRPETDRVALGGVLPYLQGGLNNRLEWKGFDLSAQVTFSLGGYIYDDAAKRQRWMLTRDGDGASLGGSGWWNMRADMLEDRWLKEGDKDKKYPVLTWDPAKLGLKDAWQNNSSAFLEKADFARLRNVTFGYNVPIKATHDIKSMRLYFIGANLYTLTNYTGWDVEIARETSDAGGRNIGGANNSFLTAPQERSYMFGLDLSF